MTWLRLYSHRTKKALLLLVSFFVRLPSPAKDRGGAREWTVLFEDRFSYSSKFDEQGFRRAGPGPSFFSFSEIGIRFPSFTIHGSVVNLCSLQPTMIWDLFRMPLAVAAPRRDLGGLVLPKSQKLLEENGIKLVGYTFRLKN